MTTNILLQQAFLLHRRAYRENSFLIELFTKDYGRLTCIVRGARQKYAHSLGMLQAFVPLLVSWGGKNDLKYLSHVELHGPPASLKGMTLFAGFYLNELMIGLLHKWDPHPALYDQYEQTLNVLKIGPLSEVALRAFEKNLLEELGYGLLPKTNEALYQTFSEIAYYRFIPEQGFELVNLNGPISSHLPFNFFLGKNLISIAQNNWNSAAILHDAKRLMRLALQALMGTRELHSRKLFILHTLGVSE